MFAYLLQTLGQEYETIVKKKPLSVLEALLLSGFDNRYKLMDIYVKAIQMNTDEVIVLCVTYQTRDSTRSNEYFQQT